MSEAAAAADRDESPDERLAEQRRAFEPPRIFLDALAHAVRAPSTHNAQPWAFALAGDTIEVWADRDRALPVCDPDGRELVLSVGCVVHHLRVALGHLGRPLDVAYLPDAARPDLLAALTLRAPAPESMENERLFDAIAQRRTDRGPFLPDAPPPDVLAAVARAAHAEGCALVALEAEADRARLVDLIAQADRAQQHDPLFRDELAAWLNPTPASRDDGVVLEAALGARVIPWIVRTFDRGDGEAARHRELAEGSPVLALLCTRDEPDEPRAWLRAGEALSRALLTAANFGLGASYLNQPLEVPALRAQVAALAPAGHAPQLVLRLGYGKRAPAPTPRRAVASCLRAPGATRSGS